MKGIELFVPKQNQALVYRGEKSDDIIAQWGKGWAPEWETMIISLVSWVRPGDIWTNGSHKYIMYVHVSGIICSDKSYKPIFKKCTFLMYRVKNVLFAWKFTH